VLIPTLSGLLRRARQSLEEALARAEHRDAAWARGEWEHVGGPFSPVPRVTVPVNGFTQQDRAVEVDGEQRVIPLLSLGHYQALRFEQDTKAVTAVARFGFPEALSFYTVDDLGPYVAGFRRFMLGLLRSLGSALIPCTSRSESIVATPG
jgi:hypothetical protein